MKIIVVHEEEGLPDEEYTNFFAVAMDADSNVVRSFINTQDNPQEHNAMVIEGINVLSQLAASI